MKKLIFYLKTLFLWAEAFILWLFYGALSCLGGILLFIIVVILSVLEGLFIFFGAFFSLAKGILSSVYCLMRGSYRPELKMRQKILLYLCVLVFLLIFLVGWWIVGPPV